MDTIRTIEGGRRHEEITSSRTYNRIKDSFPHAEREAVIALALLRKLSPRLSSDRTIPYDRLACFVQDEVNLRENADEIMKYIYSWTSSLSDDDVLIPGWIAHILPDDPLPASIIKAEGLSENSRYAELDDAVIILGFGHAFQTKGLQTTPDVVIGKDDDIGDGIDADGDGRVEEGLLDRDDLIVETLRILDSEFLASSLDGLFFSLSFELVHISPPKWFV